MSKTQEIPSLAELRQRILDGVDVTPEEYAQARTLAELDELQAVAEQQAAARQAEAERLDRIRAIAQKLIADYEDDREQDDIDAIRAAVASIVRRADHRRIAFDEASLALAREGVIPDGEPAAGISQHPHAMGLGHRIVIGEQTITYLAPGRTLADAISSGLGDIGKKDAALMPGVVVRGSRKPRQETPEQARRREQLRRDALAEMRRQEQEKAHA